MTTPIPPRSIRMSLLALSLVMLLWLVLAHALPTYGAGQVTNCTAQGLFNAMSSGNGLITFNCGGTNAPATITILTAGGLPVGAGSRYTIDGGNVITLSGAHNNRIFQVAAGSALTLTRILLTDGYATGAGPTAPSGGAILNTGGRLVLDHASVRNSESTFAGGAIEDAGGTTLLMDSLIENNRSDYGGGIDSIGTLTLINTTVRANQALTHSGGGLDVGAVVEIINSQITGNTAKGSAGADGGGGGGGLKITATGQVAVSGSRFEANRVTTTTNGYGGAILNLGVLTVTQSSLTVNSANYGGGIGNFSAATLYYSTLNGNTADYGAGIANFSAATLYYSTLNSNMATSWGGGIDNQGSTLVLVNSTLSGNTAEFGGGIFNYNAATLATLENSTLSGNSAYSGGGIHNYAGGLMLNNSTLSGNAAGYRGGGIYLSDGTAALGNSTLSGNSALGGGGIYNEGGQATLTNVTLNNRVPVNGTAHNLNLAGGVLTLTNSIVKSDDLLVANCFGGGFPKSVSLGHNLANDTSCGLMSSGDQQGPLVAILLGALLNHGGPTLTQLPRVGSAAIDKGADAVCAALPVNGGDQRGVQRPLDGNGDGIATCDIGAVERRPSDTDSVPWLWLPLIRR